ncbi:hypothetical protein HMI49_33440 [Corallococcus exercitus]|uniref:Transmembrane protein n=1 Tax=Corallococcus exercitus TaxID=2316736 RepID=A0A7Y4KRM5_9BACT|nr:hypothetical protein [Corallococcus exercitus]NOK38115.1 hypothetical protein [Corallococcus exercitus]
MQRLKRGAGYVLLVLGVVVLLPALWLSGGAWHAATAPEPVLAADVVASEPTAWATACSGSNCRGLSRSESALDHYEMIKSERRLVLNAFILFFGTGVALLGVGGVLLRNSGAPAQAGSD